MSDKRIPSLLASDVSCVLVLDADFCSDSSCLPLPSLLLSLSKLLSHTHPMPWMFAVASAASTFASCVSPSLLLMLHSTSSLPSLTACGCKAALLKRLPRVIHVRGKMRMKGKGAEEGEGNEVQFDDES